MLIAIHCENFANLGKLGGHHDEVAFSTVGKTANFTGTITTTAPKRRKKS